MYECVPTVSTVLLLYSSFYCCTEGVKTYECNHIRLFAISNLWWVGNKCKNGIEPDECHSKSQGQPTPERKPGRKLNCRKTYVLSHFFRWFLWGVLALDCETLDSFSTINGIIRFPTQLPHNSWYVANALLLAPLESRCTTWLPVR